MFSQIPARYWFVFPDGAIVRRISGGADPDPAPPQPDNSDKGGGNGGGAPAGDPPNPKPNDAPPKPPDAPKPPEKYDLKLSDKSPLDAKDLEEIATYAKTNALTQDQAASLLQQVEARASALVERQHQMFLQTIDQWGKDTWADTNLGGANRAATEANIKRVMDRFGSDAFRKLVNETGYGNHIEFVRFVNAIGKAMAEDRPGPTGGGPPERKSIADRMYPSMAK